MNKTSKLLSAKLKICELKEKYSKNPALCANGDASPAYEQNFAAAEFKGKELFIIEQKNITDEQGSLSEYPSKLNDGHYLSSNDDTPISKHTRINATPDSSILQQISIKSSSPSEIISDLSNPHEHIHFVSSLSDEHSYLLQSSTLSSHETHVISNSRSKNVGPHLIHSTKLYNSFNENKNKNLKEIEDVTKKNSPKKKSYKNKIPEEVLHTDNGSTISSIEEEMNTSISTLERAHGDNNDLIDKLNSHQNNVVEDRTENADSQKSKSNVINLINKRLGVKNYSGTSNSFSENIHITINNNQSNSEPTDVKSSSVTKSYDDDEHTKNKDMTLEEKFITDKNHISKTIRKRTNYFKSNTPHQSIIHHKLTLNQSPTTRPILKSCKLIRYIEANKDEFETLVKKANYMSLTEDVKQDLFFHVNRTETCCDGLIKQLLTNQIQLTRHFIESHHQMYLNCCKTVKVVNEKLTSNRYN